MFTVFALSEWCKLDNEAGTDVRGKSAGGSHVRLPFPRFRRR